MDPNAPLTDSQRTAIAEMRAALAGSSIQHTAESSDERAQYPDPKSLPGDVTVHVEIAPPSTQPHPLFDSHLLKTPERVPIYFYALHDDHTQSNADLANTRVIFFIHGGGNVVGHPTHPPFMAFYAQLLRAIASLSPDVAVGPKCILVAPSYRLATVPENSFPAALQDLVAAYDYVIEKGYDPSNVFVAGDSAGGNHAVVLTHLILQSGKPSPRGVASIAPYSIQAHERMSEHAKKLIDKDIFNLPVLDKAVHAYIGDSGISPADPLVSGAYLDFGPSWPRTLILVGACDALIDGSRELKRRLADFNAPVELVEYNERPHGCWVMPAVFPENVQDGVQRLARFFLQ